jgi:SAM-dependent methyltransferase
MAGNIDRRTVASFGEEWSRFTQSEQDLAAADRRAMFDTYFRLFPWHLLPADSIGADIGCGSGRWAALVAPRVGHLYVADPSPQALAVAQANLRQFTNITAIEAAADDLPFADASLDFAYCIGVLHHLPDTQGALRAICAKLKPAAPLLVYIYYALDNRGALYRLLWRISNLGRAVLSRSPRRLQQAACSVIACCVYWPLARIAALLHPLGLLPQNWPLAYYRQRSLYVMRTDAYDRFCTPLEKRFSRAEIEQMLKDCGCEDIRFSPEMPFWCAVARKSCR